MHNGLLSPSLVTEFASATKGSRISCLFKAFNLLRFSRPCSEAGWGGAKLCPQALHWRGCGAQRGWPSPLPRSLLLKGTKESRSTEKNPRAISSLLCMLSLAHSKSGNWHVHTDPQWCVARSPISCGICTAGQTWHVGVSAGVQELAIHQQPSCSVCLFKQPQMRERGGGEGVSSPSLLQIWPEV